MIRNREEVEQSERRRLAPFATFAADSHRRRHPEAPAAYRSCFQRDRDRIVHSRSFRRLEYKTQVFLNGTGDHYRTRLTHTIEVASVARSVARTLGVNEDLTEAIALAHDVGHAPFGHCGERTLDDLMSGHGGFDHNRQALRVVEYLERRYPSYEGLNLTWEVRAGLVKRRGEEPPEPIDGIRPGRSPSLEAQIADVADDLAYYCHDLDDGIEAGLIDERDLEDLPLWREVRERLEERNPGLEPELRQASMIRGLFDSLVRDLIRNTADRIRRAGVADTASVRDREEPLAAFSDGMKDRLDELRDFLYLGLYYHPEVSMANDRAVAVMVDLFDHYLRNPETMGAGSIRRIERDGLERAVCDYVAGMTDRYAFEQHQRLCRSPGT